MGSQVHCGGMWENTELEKRQECLCSQLATMCSKQSSSPGANSFRTSLKAESYLRGTRGRLSSPCSGRGSVLLTPSYTADVKGQRPWNACLWDSSLFRTPQRELSVRCSRRKKKMILFLGTRLFHLEKWSILSSCKRLSMGQDPGLSRMALPASSPGAWDSENQLYSWWLQALLFPTAFVLNSADR